MKRSAPKRKATIPPAPRAHAVNRSFGVCIVCLHRHGWNGRRQEARRLLGQGKARSVAQLHHVLPERLFPRWAVEELNLVGVCVPCHAEHENAHRRIPWEALPPQTVIFARALASAEAAAYFDRTYPRVGPTAGGTG